MFAFAHTLFAPSMALALVILGFQLVMGLRAATLRSPAALAMCLRIVRRGRGKCWRLAFGDVGFRGLMSTTASGFGRRLLASAVALGG